MRKFILCLMLLVAVAANAGPYRQLDFLVTGLFNTDGTPLSGGSVSFYLPGTTTSATVYLDPAGATPAANPIKLNTYGRPDGTTYGVLFTNRSLKVVAKDADGVTRGTFDYLYYGSASSGLEIRERQTSTAGQTVFNLANSYTVGNNSITVYINGIRQHNVDYTETSTTRVTLATGTITAADVDFVIRKE